MKEHRLKCAPEPFEAMREGRKPFEFRRDDRGYEVGDLLVLMEWRPIEVMPEQVAGFTGRELRRNVTYVLHGPDFGVPVGFAVLGLREHWPLIGKVIARRKDGSAVVQLADDEDRWARVAGLQWEPQ